MGEVYVHGEGMAGVESEKLGIRRVLLGLIWGTGRTCGTYFLPDPEDGKERGKKEKWRWVL